MSHLAPIGNLETILHVQLVGLSMKDEILEQDFPCGLVSSLWVHQIWPWEYKKKWLLRQSLELISQRDNTLFNAFRPARRKGTVFPSSWRLFDESRESQRMDDYGVSFKGGGSTVSLGAANESGTMQGHTEDTAAESRSLKVPFLHSFSDLDFLTETAVEEPRKLNYKSNLQIFIKQWI